MWRSALAVGAGARSYLGARPGGGRRDRRLVDPRGSTPAARSLWDRRRWAGVAHLREPAGGPGLIGGLVGLAGAIAGARVGSQVTGSSAVCSMRWTTGPVSGMTSTSSWSGSSARPGRLPDAPPRARQVERGGAAGGLRSIATAPGARRRARSEPPAASFPAASMGHCASWAGSTGALRQLGSHATGLVPRSGR